MAPAPLPTRTPDRVASVVEVRPVNAPVLAVEAPTVVPFTEPPVRATALAFWVAIVPKPKFVRAVAASVAPVPPRTTESVPVVPATIGSPVAFVSVAADGVPKLGVVKVGEVLNAMPPEPVTFCPNAVATPVPNEVIPVPPLATGKTPVALARA